MSLARRLWIYQAERFPLKKTVPLLAVFSAASINVSAFLAGRDLPGWPSYVVGFFFAMVLFFQMRACDEWKDRDIDATYRPERAIPRGLVPLELILAIAGGLGGMALLVVLGVNLSLTLLLVLTWGWLIAMTFEFGAKQWLIAHPLVYLVSHMAIMPLIDLLLTGVEWAGRHDPAPALGIFLALSFVNGCVLEIGRKVWAPEAERTGVDSYSRLWGPDRAAWIWLGFVAAAAMLLVALGAALAMLWSFALVAAAALIAAGAVVASFARAPSAAGQARLDAAAGLWVLLCYGTAGFLPLIRGLL